VVTDSSEIAGTLNQNGRLDAFFSRMLQRSELQHPSIVKEAQAIIEAECHWKHYLTCKHFTLRTYQKSVRFMFHLNHRGKIKRIKFFAGELSYHVTVLILCTNRVGTIFRQIFVLKFHVLYQMANLFDSCTMRYVMRVLQNWRILFEVAIFQILLTTSNELLFDKY